MRIRGLILTALCASVFIGATAPAFAHDDWHRQEWQEQHERQEWREHAWRQHEAREHEWRENNWRGQYYAPPVIAIRPYGYGGPPPVYYGNPGYYR